MLGSILLHALAGLALAGGAAWLAGAVLSWWVGVPLGIVAGTAVLLLAGFAIQAQPKRMPWEDRRRRGERT